MNRHNFDVRSFLEDFLIGTAATAIALCAIGGLTSLLTGEFQVGAYVLILAVIAGFTLPQLIAEQIAQRR